MTNIAPFPTRPSPREAAFDREIEELVAPGLADDLGVPESYLAAQAALDAAARRRLTRPDPDESRTPATVLSGFEAAVLGDMKAMTLEGRKALWRAAQRILEAEHRGHAVVAIHVVTATAVNEARA